jgi:hypothetical protein
MATYGKREKHEPARQFLIRLPLEVDARLEEDARRCRRSKTRQVEAILVDFYGMESTDLQEPPGTRSRSTSNLARASSEPHDSGVSARAADRRESGYLMSLGTGRAPTDKDRRAAGKDMSKARQLAREHQKLKKK